MSLTKRRTKKSVNSSLSQASNSENLRDSSMFKNDVLCQIKNIHIADVIRSSRKETLQGSSNKKPRVVTKQAESKQNKVYNYSTLTKVVQEKNMIIDTQQRQIENLKIALERVRKELDLTRVDFEKKKLEDLSLLKQQQRENDQNIKELEILKNGLKQMKSKMEGMQIENSKLNKKNNDYLNEIQDLTVKITSIKEEYLNKSVDEKVLNNLKQELNILKEQGKITKELQVQKNSLEERCKNFEKKINEYIFKYNEVQGEFNQSQIKYYRAQKDNDDLKLTIQDIEVDNKNLKKMLQEEKLIMVEQTEKWNGRLHSIQKKSKGDRCLTEYYEAKAAFSEFGQKFKKIQEQTLYQQKIDEKQIQVTNLKQQLNKLQQMLENKQLYIREIQQKLITNQSNIHQKLLCIQDLQDKSNNLLIENDRLHYNIQKIANQQKQETAKFLQIRNQEKKRIQSQKLTQIQKITNQITILKEAYNKNTYKSQQKLQQVLIKQQKLQKALSNHQEQKQKLQKQIFYEKEEKQKIQSKISQTNIELKQIKQIVCKYGEEIKQLNYQLEQSDRNLQNEIYLKREEKLKSEEELKYYKGKYGEIFNQNIELSEKVCQIQRQNTEQINKNTALLNEKKDLENIFYRKEETIGNYCSEINQLKNRVHELENLKQKMFENLQQSQSIRKTQQTKIYHLEEENKVNLRRQQRQVNDKQKIYHHQVKQIEKRYQEQIQQCTEASKREGELIKRQFRQKYTIMENKYTASLKEALEKDKILQKKCEILQQKQRQIYRLQTMKNQFESEEFVKIKSYNVRLTQQIDQITAQFNRGYQELNKITEKNNNNEKTISKYQRDINQLKQKNMELSTELSSSHRIQQRESDQLLFQNNNLKIKMVTIQEKLQNQTQECSQWMSRFEEVSKQYRRMQNDCNKVSRSYLDQSNKKNKETHKEVESYRSQIRILQEQNAQLQQVMDRELSKRKIMIEELIQEKKVLYEQLSRH